MHFEYIHIACNLDYTHIYYIFWGGLSDYSLTPHPQPACKIIFILGGVSEPTFYFIGTFVVKFAERYLIYIMSPVTLPRFIAFFGKVIMAKLHLIRFGTGRTRRLDRTRSLSRFAPGRTRGLLPLD